MSLRFPPLDIRKLYDGFDAPVAGLDCGAWCAPYHPSGKPFCCDVVHAVPAVYRQEWQYLRQNTDLWQAWRGDEGGLSPEEAESLRAEVPETMQLLACQGPERCQRGFRALSCRQFPFFPYVTEDFRFLGLVGQWEFSDTCWVLNHLDQVSAAYRREFIRTYDRLFDLWPEEFESYAIHSEHLRQTFIARRRRIPLLHRNGNTYLLSPARERLRRVAPESLPRFGPYAAEDAKGASKNNFP